MPNNPLGFTKVTLIPDVAIECSSAIIQISIIKDIKTKECIPNNPNNPGVLYISYIQGVTKRKC